MPGEITVLISVVSIPLMIYFLYVNPLSDGLGGFASALDVGMAANPNAPLPAVTLVIQNNNHAVL